MSEKQGMDAANIDVAYVANLARLHLTDEEIATYQPQLEQVVAYVRQIDELDLDDVEPMSHAVDVKNVFREDEVRPSLDHETVMANAPAEVNDQFKVPKIME